MRWWESSIGGAARGRIIALLRRRARSVDEIAADLGVTDNAVRAHLELLEREGIVAESHVRRTGSVGKPATMYAIAPGAEAALSAAYAPVLSVLTKVLSERMPERELAALYRDVGRRLAAEHLSRRPAARLETRARDAAALLVALGAEVDVVRGEESITLRGHACPLAEAVRADPAVCQSIRALVADVTGAPVRECCEHGGEGGTPKCRLEIRRTA